MNIRKSIFFILAFLITANCLAIQDKEWAGDLFPKDFEKFALEKHTIINGNLMVYNSTIKDLHLLESLEVVKGNVQIGIYDYKKDIKAGNDLIETLNGLQNLTTISGSLVIRENKVLKNISALKNLKTVHNISISYNLSRDYRSERSLDN